MQQQVAGVVRDVFVEQDIFPQQSKNQRLKKGQINFA